MKDLIVPNYFNSTQTDIVFDRLSFDRFILPWASKIAIAIEDPVSFVENALFNSLNVARNDRGKVNDKHVLITSNLYSFTRRVPSELREVCIFTGMIRVAYCFRWHSLDPSLRESNIMSIESFLEFYFQNEGKVAFTLNEQYGSSFKKPYRTLAHWRDVRSLYGKYNRSINGFKTLPSADEISRMYQEYELQAFENIKSWLISDGDGWSPVFNKLIRYDRAYAKRGLTKEGLRYMF